MIDFAMSNADLAKAVRQLTKARSGIGDELVDLTCSRDNVRFLVTGRDISCPAQTAAAGMARLPLAILPKLQRAAATFEEESLRIRIESGRIRVNSMTITMDGVITQKIVDRPIDIPDDASHCDLLALRYIFSPQEIVDSGLESRFRAAYTARIKNMDLAFAHLAEYGVTADSIDALVTEAIKARAETMRTMLRPPMISERPN